MPTYEIGVRYMVPGQETIILDADNVDEAELFATESIDDTLPAAEDLEIDYIREVKKDH